MSAASGIETGLAVALRRARKCSSALGVAEQMDEVGRRIIRDFMPDQHRAFFAQLPFVVHWRGGRKRRCVGHDHRADGRLHAVAQPTSCCDQCTFRIPRDPARPGRATARP